MAGTVYAPQKHGTSKTMKSYWWQYPEAIIFFNYKKNQCIDRHSEH